MDQEPDWGKPDDDEPKPDLGASHWPLIGPRVDGFEPGVGDVVSALDRLVEPAELDDVGLAERLTDLVRLQSRVASEVSRHVRVWDVRGGWVSDRSKSAAARLAREANCSKVTAASSVALAREVAVMPGTAAAWSDGRISTDHVRRLVRACTGDRRERFLADEEDLISAAVDLAGNFAGFHRVVSVWEQYVDDEMHDPTDPNDLPKGEKRRREGRHCTLRESDDGWDLKGSLTKVGGEIVRTQLQRCFDDLWRQDWNEARDRLGEGTPISEADLGRTHRQRWADALVEMARRAGACLPGDALPMPLVTVHVTATEMTGPIRETFNGLALSRRDVADLIASGADWERVICGPSGQPVNLTSVQRNFTGALRRAVQLRDRVCSHPTCDVEAERCQVDHVVEHSAGGPTNIDNARLLCPKHNLQRPGRGKKPPRRSSNRAGAGGDDVDCHSDVDGR